MSQDKSTRDEPSFNELLQKPAMRAYMLVGFMSLLMYYLLMLARGGELGGLVALILAIPGLVGLWSSSPAFFLIITAYVLFDPNFDGLLSLIDEYAEYEGPIFRRGSGPFAIDPEDLLLALTVIVVVATMFRILSLMQRGMPEDPAPLRKGQIDPGVPRRPSGHYQDAELVRFLVLLIGSFVSGLMGWWLIIWIDRNQGFSVYWDFPRIWGRLLLFGWALGLMVVIVSGIFWYRRLRRMNPAEARLILLDSVWQETRREQERIYRWRRWYRQRQTQRSVASTS